MKMPTTTRRISVRTTQHCSHSSRYVKTRWLENQQRNLFLIKVKSDVLKHCVSHKHVFPRRHVHLSTTRFKKAFSSSETHSGGFLLKCRNKSPFTFSVTCKRQRIPQRTNCHGFIDNFADFSSTPAAVTAEVTELPGLQDLVKCCTCKKKIQPVSQLSGFSVEADVSLLQLHATCRRV